MAGFKDYTTVAAGNTSLFPENMNPSAVNDGMRQVQADAVTAYRDSAWQNWGDTPSRAAAAQFKIASDVTSRYVVGRRVRCNDASTLYGVITASAYSAPDTTIDVTLDTGSLTASLTAVAIASDSPTNSAFPRRMPYLEVAGTATVSGAAVFKTTATIEGAATISGAAVFKTTATIEGAATVSGAAVFKTTMTVEGEVTISGTATVKGTLLEIKGDATNTGRIRQYEDSDNGTNYIEHKPAASLAANRTVTWADTDISQHLVQYVYTQTGAVATGTTTMPLDDTIHQNNEGDQYLSQAITPKNASNILEIDALLTLANSGNASFFQAALFQDSTANALASEGGMNVPTNGHTVQIKLKHFMAAGTTSETTFKIRAGCSTAGTTTFNGTGGTRYFGGVLASYISIKEYSV